MIFLTFRLNTLYLTILHMTFLALTPERLGAQGVLIVYTSSWHKSNRKAMNRNRSNQKANPALKTKAGINKYYK